jgi:hypothetical protein
MVQLDTWLVSDAALVDLAVALPSLQLVTRDGRVLLCVAGAAAAAAGPAVLEQQVYHTPLGGAVASTAAAVEGGVASWLSAAAAARTAAGRLQDGSAGIQGSWSAAHNVSSAVSTATAAAAAAASARAPAGSTSTARGGGRQKQSQPAGSSSTVHSRLSKYDERYRYTTEQLVSLRVSASGAGSAAAAGLAGVPAELKASSVDSWRQTSE